MSQLRTNSIVPVGGIPAGASGGGIIQTVHTIKTDTFTTTSNSYVDLTGLSVSITPASTSNKILIFYYIGGSSNGSGYDSIFKLVRNSTDIALAAAAGNRKLAQCKFQATSSSHTYFTSALHLDSPSLTSSITYKVQIAVQNGGTSLINRTGADNDNTDAFNARTTSGIVAMEVSG